MTDTRKETRDEAIARWEANGWLVKDCAGCKPRYDAADRMPWEVPGPSHTFSSMCRSGKRPHCTCDACF